MSTGGFSGTQKHRNLNKNEYTRFIGLKRFREKNCRFNVKTFWGEEIQ